MAEAPLTIGIHPGGLARAQAERVARMLAARGVDFAVHLEIIPDLEERPSPLHDDHIAENRGEIGHLHSLLREGVIDVVIHRGFDLRGDIADDLRIAAVLPRSNPYDVLLAPTEILLDEFEESARIGVVQLRARAQLLDYRDDLQWELVSGDASEWLTALIDRRIDALVAPGAAIENLGLTDQICELFPPEMVVPAPGSGILLCVVRASDRISRDRLRPLHDGAAAIEYTAECAVLESLGGPWELAIGALAQLRSSSIALHTMVATADGTELVREQHVASADDPCRAGAEAAALLIQAGADRILDGLPPEAADDPCPPIAGELPSVAEDHRHWALPDDDPDFADYEDLVVSEADESEPEDD